MDFEIRRASELDEGGLLALWNAGYEGYFVPITMTAEQLARHVRCGGVDLDRSLAMWVGGEPAAFSYLAVDGERGWIGGFGVAPAFRGRGLSYALMREHAARFAGWGLRRVQLELFEQNWVRKTYELAGFRVTRRLPYLTGVAPTGRPLPSVALEDALAHHDRLHAAFPASWNREPRFIRRAFPADGAAVVAGSPDRPSGFLLAAPVAERVRVYDAAAEDDEAAARLVEALGALFPGRSAVVVNEAEGSPVHRALLAAGLVEESAQLEMHWTAEG
ncbi:MAG TPA: GNAT family N-acetyltransferase [Longimicrobium sp.]|nr:GNAT family N-acetyltransferase [Longimicrobium sp.]